MNQRPTFFFDAARCTGCKTCVMACKDYRDLRANVAFRQVFEYVGGGWTHEEGDRFTNDVFAYYVSLACNHCMEPVCVKVCPTGAMHRDDLGFICVDTMRCIGCGYCALSCPYHAPHLDDELGHSVKCDGCTDRVHAGLAPICVASCPRRALDLGTYDEMVEQHGPSTSIEPLPDPSLTTPGLVIRPSRNARESGQGGGSIVNTSELV